MSNMYFLLSVFFLLVASSQSARILGIVAMPSYSHQIPFHPLWKELSRRGHQVTLLTTDPIADPSLTNLTEIDLHRSYEIFHKVNMVDVAKATVVENFNNFAGIQVEMQDYQLSHPEVQQLIRDESQQFDLLLAEAFTPTMYAFAVRFKCPFIQIFSLDAPGYNYHLIGNPSHPVLDQDYMLPYSGELSFLERLGNTATTLYVKYFNKFRMYPALQTLIYKHFGADYPHIEDMERDVSMFFINTDNIFHRVRPLLPTVIQFGGGTHLKPLKPLPKNLQQELDKAKQGVIYLSLGSNVKSKDLPEEARAAILETLAELPYLVLWKFELETLPNKSDNVVISKWFPQQDVLRHPNIKLFITQGGLQSLEEAVYSGVPVVGIPFFGDQHANVKSMVQKGIAVSLDFPTLTKDSFKSAILEVFNNPRYRNNVKKMAELAQDQPMKGLDKAVWWTEYVIRHKGAKHLRSPAADLPLYQYFLLDIIAVCLLVLIVASYTLFILTRTVFKLFKYLSGSYKAKLE